MKSLLPVLMSMFVTKKQAVAKADVVNDLTSTATDKPLSAAQGRVLNSKTNVTCSSDNALERIYFQRLSDGRLVLCLIGSGISSGVSQVVFDTSSIRIDDVNGDQKVIS